MSAPQLPDAAIKAAARAMWPLFGGRSEAEREDRLRDAQTILAAAYPALLADITNRVADAIPGLASKSAAPDWSSYAEGFGDALDYAEQFVREMGQQP